MFTYDCEVTYIVDGDTCDVTIDLGFKIFHKARIRLVLILPNLELVTRKKSIVVSRQRPGLKT